MKNGNANWAIDAAVLITGVDAKIGRSAKEIFKSMKNCNYEEALEDSWNLALIEAAYDDEGIK